MIHSNTILSKNESATHFFLRKHNQHPNAAIDV